jgi:CoA:oxalate CoA-transferase
VPDAALPLRGVRVLDLTTFLSGPYATHILGELGAEVVKIEPPSGDPTRAGTLLKPGDPPSPFYLALHRDRLAMTLDLKRDAARVVFRDLVARADVLVENFRPGVTARLGITYDELRPVNPRLVYCSISGFGSDGPFSQMVAIDGPVQAFSGALELTAAVGLDSTIPMPISDIAGGSLAAQAVLAALYARERSGQGCHIDLSLLEAILQWLSVGDRTGTLAPPSTLVLEGSDGLRLLVQTTLHFQERLMTLVAAVPGFETFVLDERFATRDGRKLHREEYTAGMRKAFRTRTRDEWLELLRAEGVPAAPVHTIDEAIAHPQMEHRGATLEVHADGNGAADDVAATKVLAGPFRIDGARKRRTSLPPALGEHTERILRDWLGYDDVAIAALRDDGAC